MLVPLLSLPVSMAFLVHVLMERGDSYLPTGPWWQGCRCKAVTTYAALVAHDLKDVPASWGQKSLIPSEASFDIFRVVLAIPVVWCFSVEATGGNPRGNL